MKLSHAANPRVKTYSLRMRQRLAIGPALMEQAELIILDQPRNDLDPAGIADMRDLSLFSSPDDGDGVGRPYGANCTGSESLVLQLDAVTSKMDFLRRKRLCILA